MVYCQNDLDPIFSDDLLVSNIFIMSLVVSILKGVQSPLTRAFCSSSAVKDPFESASTDLNQSHNRGSAPGGIVVEAALAGFGGGGGGCDAELKL